MAETNTLEIVLRIVSQNTQAIGQIRQQLDQMGTSARATSSHMGALEKEVSTFENVLNRVILRFISWDLIIRGVQDGFRRLEGIVRSSVEAVDQFHNQAVALAGILTDLAKTKGPETWAQNFAYATAEMERLRQKGAELGVTWDVLEKTQRAFADVGIAPQSDKELQAMVDIAKQAQFIAVTRHADIGSLVQVKGLVDGQMSSTNQLATVLRTNLGLSEQQLKNWVAQHVALQDLPQAISAAMGITKAEAAEVSHSLETQGKLLRENIDAIQRSAAAGAWQQLTSSVQELNQWILKNSGDLANALRPGFDQVGVAAQRFMAFLTDHKQEVLDALSAISSGIGNIANALERTIEAATRFVNAMHRGQQSYEDAFLGTGVAGAMRAGVDLSRMTPRYDAAGNFVGWNIPGRPAGVADTSKFDMGFAPPGGGGFPQHAATSPVQLGGGAGGGRSAFEIARQQIEAEAAHQRAMAEAIDDRAQREARIAQILRQESAELATLARHADTAAHAAEARHQAEELNVQAIVAQRNAARDAVTEQVQASREFITNQQALGQMSTQGAITAHERVLARLQGQVTAGGPGAPVAAKEAEREEVTLRQLHRQALEERIRDSETFIAREVDINGIGIDEQIADWQRVLEYLKTQHGPGVEAVLRSVMDRVVRLNREAVDQQLADDKRQFDAQRESLTLASEFESISTQAARATRDIPLGPQIAAGPGGLPASVASRSTAEVAAAAQAVVDAQAQVALAQQLQKLDDDRLAKLRDELTQTTDIVERKQIQAQIDEALKQSGQDKLAAARAELDVLKAQVEQYQAMVKPITDATHAVAQTIESDISKALTSALEGQGGRSAFTFWKMFQDIGKSVVSQVTGMISKAFTQELGIEPMLNSMFAKVARALHLVNPQDQQNLLAEITAENSKITQLNTEALATLTAAVRGQRAPATPLAPGEATRAGERASYTGEPGTFGAGGTSTTSAASAVPAVASVAEQAAPLFGGAAGAVLRSGTQIIQGVQAAVAAVTGRASTSPTTATVAQDVMRTAMAENTSALRTLTSAVQALAVRLNGAVSAGGAAGAEGSTDLSAGGGGLAGLPVVGRYVSAARSILSIFSGGGAGSLILRGMGGLLPGSFTPIPAFAGGGIAGGPTFGLIGENGPEAVIPLRSGKIPVDLGSGSSASATHNWHIYAIDRASVADMLHEHRDTIAGIVSGRLGVNHPAVRQLMRR